MASTTAFKDRNLLAVIGDEVALLLDLRVCIATYELWTGFNHGPVARWDRTGG